MTRRSFARRRPLRGSPHGVNHYIESTSLVFLLFSQVMVEWRRGDYIKSIFGQGMVRCRLGLPVSSKNLPTGSAGRDLSLHRHTWSTQLENWRGIECWRRTTNLGLLNARMALMMLTQAMSVRVRRGVEPPVVVTSMTVIDIEVAETGSGGPG
jgi:hypothetical protein